MIKKRTAILLFVVFGLFVPLNSQASEFNFSVNIKLPDNQINKEVGYLDVLMNKGSEQNVSYTLRNDTSEDIKVDVKVHSATTNSNGVIEYGESLSKKDKSLKYDIADMVTYNKKVSVPAKSSVEENLIIKAPSENFEGVIAGGITFQEDIDKKKASNGEAVGIINHFSQVKAIIVRTSENEILPDLNMLNVKADQKNARNVISMNLQNPNAAYMFGLETKIKIYKKGSNKPYISLDKDNISLAPNTNFDLPIPLNGNKLEKGKYEAMVVANWKDKEWNFKKEFTITEKVATKLNATDVDIKPDLNNTNIWVCIIISIISVLLIVVLIIYLLYRTKKKKRGKKK